MEHHDLRPLRRAHWIRVLLLVPVLGALWVPFYNRIEPAVGGVPFFYWYQLALIVVCALVCVIVYRVES
jgi:hypothetical protein